MNRLSCVVLTLALAAGCGSGGSDSIPTAPTLNVPFSTTDIRVGTGAEATVGKNVTVRYSLWPYVPGGVDNKGALNQSSTFSFTVGQGAIVGFSQGVTGMRVGGLRRIVIPPNLAYGNNPPDASIRANETLIFEVELLSVNN